MSDQDFFFDDDEGPKKPAKSETDTSKSTSAKKPASPGPSSAKTSSPSAPEAAYAVPFFERDTTMAVASLLAVIGLLVGVIGGYLLAGSLTNPAASVPPATNGAVAPAPGGTPGALTPDQLKGGQLPAGHPTIPSGTATPTK